jgi:hypothetical protein
MSIVIVKAVIVIKVIIGYSSLSLARGGLSLTGTSIFPRYRYIDYVALICRVTDERWIGKALEGRGSGPIEVPTWHLATGSEPGAYWIHNTRVMHQLWRSAQEIEGKNIIQD